MTFIKRIAALGLALTLSACGGIGIQDKTRDQHIGDGSNSDLSNMKAGIWVDPQGCEHWFIDDGLEGYADLRRTPDGKPVCNSELPKNVATGPFKAGSTLWDPI